MTKEQLKITIEWIINVYKCPIECYSYEEVKQDASTTATYIVKHVYSRYGIEIWENKSMRKLYISGMTPEEFEIFNDCVSVGFYEKTYYKAQLELEDIGRRIASAYYFRFQEDLVFSDFIKLKEILEAKYGVDLLEVSSESISYRIYKEDNFTSRYFRVSGIQCFLKDEEL